MNRLSQRQQKTWSGDSWRCKFCNSLNPIARQDCMLCKRKPDQRTRMIRGLSLTQPWATLVAIGAKRVETRGWKYFFSKGNEAWLAIHAAVKFPQEAKGICSTSPFHERLLAAGYAGSDTLPLGSIVAVAEMTACVSTDKVFIGSQAGVGRYVHEANGMYGSQYELQIDAEELQYGNYGPGRYAWLLENIIKLPKPLPCKGQLSLWEVPDDLISAIELQMPV